MTKFSNHCSELRVGKDFSNLLRFSFFDTDDAGELTIRPRCPVCTKDLIALPALDTELLACPECVITIDDVVYPCLSSFAHWKYVVDSNSFVEYQYYFSDVNPQREFLITKGCPIGHTSSTGLTVEEVLRGCGVQFPMVKPAELDESLPCEIWRFKELVDKYQKEPTPERLNKLNRMDYCLQEAVYTIAADKMTETKLRNLKEAEAAAEGGSFKRGGFKKSRNPIATESTKAYRNAKLNAHMRLYVGSTPGTLYFCRIAASCLNPLCGRWLNVTQLGENTELIPGPICRTNTEVEGCASNGTAVRNAMPLAFIVANEYTKQVHPKEFSISQTKASRSSYCSVKSVHSSSKTPAAPVLKYSVDLEDF